MSGILLLYNTAAPKPLIQYAENDQFLEVPLGYLIFPLDAIPDTIPLIGFADDIGVLAAALGVIALLIPPEAKTRADEKLKEWFGE